MATFEELTIDYWEGQKARSKKYIARLTPLFQATNDRITTDTLSVLNDRRYLRINDPVKRMKAAKRDPKMQQIEGLIERTGAASLGIILKAQPEHYREEAPLQAEIWTETNVLGLKVNPPELTKGDIKELEQQPYMGKSYPEHVTDYTNAAVNDWENSFRSVMTGRIQEVGKVSKDVQLVSDSRRLLNTMEVRAKTVMENALINTARYINREVIEAAEKAQLSIARQVGALI